MRFQQIFRITAEGGALLVDGIPLTILAEALEVFGGSPGPGLVGLPDGEEIHRQFGITGGCPGSGHLPAYWATISSKYSSSGASCLSLCAFISHSRRRSMLRLTTCESVLVGVHL